MCRVWAWTTPCDTSAFKPRDTSASFRLSTVDDERVCTPSSSHALPHLIYYVLVLYTQIARDFNFDDQERDDKLGGHISVAFFLLGLPACLIIGALTDVVQRKKLLVWTIVLGQGPCLLTLLVTQYWELFVLRTLTGVAVGGALPLVFSLTGDLFPPTSRSYASSMVGLCMHLGSMCGQGAAGY